MVISVGGFWGCFRGFVGVFTGVGVGLFFWLGFWVLLLGFLHDVVELVAVDAGFVEGVAASAVREG